MRIYDIKNHLKAVLDPDSINLDKTQLKAKEGKHEIGDYEVWLHIKSKQDPLKPLKFKYGKGGYYVHHGVRRGLPRCGVICTNKDTFQRILKARSSRDLAEIF